MRAPHKPRGVLPLKTSRRRETSRRRTMLARLLDDLDQLDLEGEHRVRRDRTAAALAVTQVGRDPQRVLAADRHQGDALGPTRDDLVEAELGRLATLVGAVEHG